MQSRCIFQKWTLKERKVAPERKTEHQDAGPTFIQKKTHVFGQAAFQDFDAAVLTLIYICDFIDIKKDLDESRLMTWP